MKLKAVKCACGRIHIRDCQRCTPKRYSLRRDWTLGDLLLADRLERDYAKKG